MGVNKSNYTGKIYYGIIAGQVARRFKEHQFDNQKKQTTEERTIYNNDNTVKGTVIEEYYESIDGLITKAYVDTSGNFGSNLMFEMQDDDSEFIFQVKLGSSYGRAIMNRIVNVDPNLLVKFRPYQFPNPENTDKNLVGCTIYQEGKEWENDKVPYMWTRENPGEMPDWEDVLKEGKTVKDNTKQTNFLIRKFNSWSENIGAVETYNPSPQTTNKPIDEDAQELINQFEAEQGGTTPPIMSLETEHAKKVAESSQNSNESPQKPPQEGSAVDDLPF